MAKKFYRVRCDIVEAETGKLKHIWWRTPRPAGSKGQNPHQRFETRKEAEHAIADRMSKAWAHWYAPGCPGEIYRYYVI